MKKFIVIGNGGAVIYKEIFPLVKDRDVFVRMSPMKFDGAGYSVVTAWYNNIKEYKRNPLVLTKTYNEVDYPKYDNYDAIEVSNVKNIPYDYDGIMGVPITFFDKWDGGQFEITGVSGMGSYFNPTKTYSFFIDPYTGERMDRIRKSSLYIKNEYGACMTNYGYRVDKIYARILIRRKR